MSHEPSTSHEPSASRRVVPADDRRAVGPARAIMVGVTGFTMLGLTKLNIQGPGITGTLKALWRKE